MFPTVRFVLIMYLGSYYEKRDTPLCTTASVIQVEIDTLEEIFHYSLSFDIVGTVYHLVIYMQSNEIHEVF